MSYVVVVQVDEYTRVYGTYRDRASANKFAENINSRIERIEDKEFEDWRARESGKTDEERTFEQAPDGHGRAGVLHIHTPRVRAATQFALGDLEPTIARSRNGL